MKSKVLYVMKSIAKFMKELNSPYKQKLCLLLKHNRPIYKALNTYFKYVNLNMNLIKPKSTKSIMLNANEKRSLSISLYEQINYRK